MARRRTLVAILAVAVAVRSGAADDPAGSLSSLGASGVAAIRPAALSAHVRFLSDDRLEGRFPGTRGHELAERYVATELQAAGVEPAGTDGGWFQQVPLRGATNDPARTSFVVSRSGSADEPLAPFEDFVLESDLRTTDVDVTAPLVFVGYGVTAPEYRWDDLAKVDVRGKIAVVLFSAPLGDRPDFFPATAHAVYSDMQEKLRRLAARGAVGMLTVFRPQDEELIPWERLAADARSEQMDWLEEGAPGTSPAGIPVRGIVHWSAFERLLARAGVKGGYAGVEARLAARKQGAIDLRAKAHVRLSATFRDLKAANVVGVLRGGDPALSREHVVYSAHLDHLGAGEPVDGDAIYNGALDDASGVAALIELAHAFAALPVRPARSVLFVAVTAEERGLLGSEYFARHPTVPRGSLVADVNIDTILALHPLHDVVALGADHSSIASDVAAAAAALRLGVTPDPEPKQVIFIRADQYSFVKEGVPSLFLVAGQKDASGATAGSVQRRKQWIATRYHSPKDEWDPSYDWEAMAQVVRADFLVGLSIATRPERPRWNAGDFFERFAASAARGP